MAKNKKAPEINASSQADIAFTVLIFFLVVSTMDIDTGIVRMLPPMADPNVKQEDIKAYRNHPRRRLPAPAETRRTAFRSADV